jgi:sarcosine oxidase subunit delta
MLLIECPYCGARAETEFSYGGEAHIQRPTDTADISDTELADFIFLRNNPKGVVLERWYHAHGCRRWFNAARDTVSYEFLAFYPMGAKPPKLAKKSYV